MAPALPDSTTTPAGEEGGPHPSVGISSTLNNVDILIKPTPGTDEKERANIISAATTAANKPTSSDDDDDDDDDDVSEEQEAAAAAVAAMEGGGNVGVSFAENATTSAPLAATPGGGHRPRLMSPVSAVYDRTGKGYLDSTEMALRKMDSQNLGYVDMNKVFGIMESLQEEQKKSSLLIESLHKEQRRAMSLRKALTGICIFAVLLACSNIGTSFAAARLAKDTIIYPTSNDLINQVSGERIATTNKMVEIKINPIPSLDGLPERRRRHLQEVTALACGTNPQNNLTTCALAGEIAYDDAVHLYQQFCSNWPFPTDETNPQCVGGGIPGALVQCGKHKTWVEGGTLFPTGVPGEINGGWTVFPDVDKPYQALATIEEPLPPGLGTASWMSPQTTCTLRVRIKMYCKKNHPVFKKCQVFYGYENGICKGDVAFCPANVL